MGRAGTSRSPECGVEPDCTRDPDLRATAEARTPEMRFELRRSMRCPCSGERWDLKPYRVTLPVLDDDFGEQVLRDVEEATGVRPPACPWRALTDPFVVEIIRAFAWWEVGELSARYGGRVPEAVVWGIDEWRTALNSVRIRDMREDAKQREEERRKAELNKPNR